METLITAIREKKRHIDSRRPLATAALDQLRRHYDVELTYTSNAIEGNTLTLRETAEVIEHGITVGGKSLGHHLEAVDHHAAVQWMRQVASDGTPVGEATIRDLHARIVARSRPEIAGRYSAYARRIAGSSVVFPNPAKIPELMLELGRDLSRVEPTPVAAFEIHFRLTAVHPFTDGNGRTARLLMNLLLIRSGYPPIAIRPQDRSAYLAALEHGSLMADLAPFQMLLHRRLDATLDDYLQAIDSALPDPSQN